MYCFDSRVRYSETDERGRLSLTGILNYLQDCSTFQSEDLGMGIEYLKAHDRAWWLSSWQIVIDRYPELGERIVVSTWPYDFKGIYGYRNFAIQDTQGHFLVRANSVWFFFDTEKQRPALRGSGAQTFDGVCAEEDPAYGGVRGEEAHSGGQAPSGYQPSCQQC